MSSSNLPLQSAGSTSSEVSASNDMQRVHARLEDLEVKAAFSEDLLEQLNLTIYQQQQLIERLVREVTLLRQQTPDGDSGGMRNLRDELPPHY